MIFYSEIACRMECLKFEACYKVFTVKTVACDGTWMKSETVA